MKWLLVVLIFNAPEGQGNTVVTKAYDTQGECNVVGNDVRSVFTNLSEDVKTISVCLPESAFSEEGWRQRS